MDLAPRSLRVAALLKKTQAARARLVFAVDATASREQTWDLAASVQSAMFEEAAKIGGLDVQLIYYRGDEVQQSSWLSDAHELVSKMRTIRCMSGATQIARVLRHIRAENEHGKIAATVFIGDAVEELPDELYAIATELGVPLFMFQEGDALAIYVNQHGGLVHNHPPTKVETVFRELARLSGGAYGRFDAGAAKQLRDFMAATAAFAVGGITALAKSAH
jgi:hypothetical protein